MAFDPGLGDRDTVISFEDVSFNYRYAERPALNGINLNIRRGEIVAVTGPTGAGKTTLCLCTNGLIPNSYPGQFGGKVTVCGVDTSETAVAELAKQVGMVFQDPECQLFGLTVEEEIAFGPENHGMPRDEMRSNVAWALERTRTTQSRSKSPYELSGGQKQRVAIASALALKPTILVLDEPTSELDPVGKREVFEVITELKRLESITILLVEHEAEFIAEFADRVVLVYEGQILLDEPPHRFYAQVEELSRKGIRVPEVSSLGSRLIRSRLWKEPTPILMDDAERRCRSLVAESESLPQSTSSGRGEGPPLAAPPAIETIDLHYVYPDGTTALRGIDLRIDQGEFVCIIGQNGSGKTTLAKHFNGLLRPSKGRVLINGRDTKGLSTAELAHFVGYVFQNPDHQIFSNTVAEEVAFGPKMLGLSEVQVRDAVEQALETVGITHLMNEHPMFTSRGERQLIAIASVIAMRQPIIVIDEPTTGQDARHSGQLLALMKRLVEEGLTIVAITHDMRLVAAHHGRTVALLDGRILVDGETRAVFSHPEILAASFVEPPQIAQLSLSLRDVGFGVSLTVDEFYDQILDLTGSNPVNVDLTSASRGGSQDG